MTNLRRETRWLATSLTASGSLTLGLGVLALVLPEATLIAGMLTVGLIAVLSGLNQILSAASIRARAPLWRILLAHGALSLVFGLLTVGATGLTLKTAIGVITVWLVARALLAVHIARRERPSKRIRYALVASAVIDSGGAVLVIVIPAFTIFQYLFFGAAYAVVFGASQLVAGVSLRHTRLDHPLALAGLA